MKTQGPKKQPFWKRAFSAEEKAEGVEPRNRQEEIDKKRAKKAQGAMSTNLGGEKVPVFNRVLHRDFLEMRPTELPQFDRVITNPSFEIWLKFAEHCFLFGPHTTLLLPFNSVASKSRAEWWRAHPAHLRVLSKRPSFAISVKCKMSSKKNKSACTYQELIALDAKPKKVCPLCGEGTQTTRSDSSEYNWTTWAPEITRGLWDVIDTPDPEEKT